MADVAPSSIAKTCPLAAPCVIGDPIAIGCARSTGRGAHTALWTAPVPSYLAYP